MTPTEPSNGRVLRFQCCVQRKGFRVRRLRGAPVCRAKLRASGTTAARADSRYEHTLKCGPPN